MAVSPACQGSRFLYFSPLTSLKLFRLKTAALNNEKDISNSVEELGSKSSQSDGLAMDNRGNLYIPVLVLVLILVIFKYLPNLPHFFLQYFNF